jgi:hypothetical protein
MRIELSDGEILELSDQETQALYEALLERVRQRGALSAARKLRPALAWSSGARTKVAFDYFETKAVEAVGEDDRPG